MPQRVPGPRRRALRGVIQHRNRSRVPPSILTQRRAVGLAGTCRNRPSGSWQRAAWPGRTAGQRAVCLVNTKAARPPSPRPPPGSPCPIRLHEVCSPHSCPCPPGHRSAPLFCFAIPGQTRGCRQQAGRWLGCTGNLAGPRLRGCVGEAQLHFTIML